MYAAIWPAPAWPLTTSAVPFARVRLSRTARGSDTPLNTANVADSVAATSVVSAAAMITRRWAFIRGTVSESRVYAINTEGYAPGESARERKPPPGLGLCGGRRCRR